MVLNICFGQADILLAVYEMLVMRQLDNILKNKDSSFIYTPEGMYFSEQILYNCRGNLYVKSCICINEGI